MCNELSISTHSRTGSSWLEWCGGVSKQGQQARFPTPTIVWIAAAGRSWGQSKDLDRRRSRIGNRGQFVNGCLSSRWAEPSDSHCSPRAMSCYPNHLKSHSSLLWESSLSLWSFSLYLSLSYSLVLVSWVLGGLSWLEWDSQALSKPSHTCSHIYVFWFMLQCLFSHHIQQKFPKTRWFPNSKYDHFIDSTSRSPAKYTPR